MTPALYVAAIALAALAGVWLYFRAAVAVARGAQVAAESRAGEADAALARERERHAATASERDAQRRRAEELAAQAAQLREQLRARESGADAWDRVAGSRR
jgi:hypothetical protein